MRKQRKHYRLLRYWNGLNRGEVTVLPDAKARDLMRAKVVEIVPKSEPEAPEEPEEPGKEDESKETEPDGEEGAEEPQEYDIEELRAIAKDAKIQHWHMKGYDTLVQELSQLNILPEVDSD